MAAFLSARSLTKTYRLGSSEVRALDDVSVDIEEGEFVAIMGPSGSGKSTLMHVLGLLDRADAGHFRLNGQDVTALSDDELASFRQRTIGFIFQQFHLLPRTTALDNVQLPLHYGDAPVDAAARAAQLLAEVGLGQRLNHRPNELSGGQQQRVAIARALIHAPRVILADEPTGNLDSKSEAEILQLLRRLHREGMTLILVTHEEAIGAQADRTIRMRDGKIVSDTRAAGNKGRPRIPEPPVQAVALEPARARRWALARSLNRYVRQALTALAANKVRTGLSVLGITIGVAAVIAMLALGRGASQAMKEQLSSLGSNLLIVTPASRRSGAVALQAGSVTRFRIEDADAILRQIPHVTAVNPTATGRAQVVYGNRNVNTQVVGVTPAYERLRGYTPAVGQFFTEADDRRRARVVLLGVKPATALFGDDNPIGQTVRINRIPFQVIGVFTPKGSSGFRDQDDLVVIPLRTALYRVLGRTFVDYIDLQTTGPDVMNEVSEAVEALVIERLRIPPSQTDTFEVRNLADIQQALSQTSRIMSLLLSIVAAISLLVGGIGIMNIMLVSVTERTREIGLRKALGARSRDILAQFLVESLTTSLIGGFAGLAIGGLATLIMATAANWTVSVTPDAVALAVFFSAAVGVVFGLWPARKAAALEPIVALRYE